MLNKKPITKLKYFYLVIFKNFMLHSIVWFILTLVFTKKYLDHADAGRNVQGVWV